MSVRRDMIRSIGIFGLLFLLGACGGKAIVGAGGTGGTGGSGGAPGTGGSGGAPASCGSLPAPCGGDLTGTWSIQKVCGATTTQGMPIGNCSNATLTIGVASARGTYQFDASGAWQEAISGTTSAKITAPAGCISGSDCTNFASMMQQGSPEITQVNCSFQGACTCSMSVTASLSGTYRVSGPSVTISESAGSLVSYDYCVSGNMLTLVDRSPGASDTLVFTRALPSG